MRIELAPMEGITTYIYRNALNKYYGGVDTYFTPFISTHKDKELNFKEKKEIRPDNNESIELVPQILTSDADEFLYTSGKIAEYGYRHVNLNFGCPSATVTKKGKGSGALINTDELERLLDAIFTKSDLEISVKTRMGYESYEEWEKLLSIYEKYPLKELIVHARVREDFYNGNAKPELLKDVNSRVSAFSYNGDIYNINDYKRVSDTIPGIQTVMIGRGILSAPWLACDIKKSITDSGTVLDNNVYLSDKGVTTKEELSTFKAFNHELVSKYSEIMPGEKNTMFKLKELWIYMIKSFEDTDVDAKKLLKSIRKSNSIREYERIIDAI